LDDRVVVGREARNLELQHPDRVVRSAKRDIGSDKRYAIAGRSLAPEEVSAEVLRELKREAERRLGQPLSKVVITVPAYFDDAQRRATLRAGELAGFDVLRLLNEPTAASLVYDQLGPTVERGESELILVYDLGGGTFDVSVLEVMHGVREVRSTTGNTRLGGDDFDDKLVQRFIDVLRTRERVDPREDARAMARLRRAAEECKIALSSEFAATVREEFIARRGDVDVHLELDVYRDGFEAMIDPLIESTMDLCEQAIRDAGISAAELSRVVLVGGSTRIPLVHKRLRERFGVEVHDEVDADLAVAHGAAIQSALLQGASVDRILVDVASHTLGVAAIGENDMDDPDTFVPIVPKNTVLPAARSQTLYTVADQQRSYLVEVFQGELPRASQNARVGSFLHQLALRPARSPLNVTFEYDLNGIVRVASVALAAQAGALRPSLAPDDQRLLDSMLDSLRRATTEDARRGFEEELLDFFDDVEDELGGDLEDSEDELAERIRDVE
jgi:molecular chaperone DnaK